MRFLSYYEDSFVIGFLSFFAFVIITPFILHNAYKLKKRRKQYTESEKRAFTIAGLLMMTGLCLTALFSFMAIQLKQITGYKFVIELGGFKAKRICLFEPKYLYDDVGLYIVILTIIFSVFIIWSIYGTDNIRKPLLFIPIYFYFFYFFILFPFNFFTDRKRLFPSELPHEITEKFYREMGQDSPCRWI